MTTITEQYIRERLKTLGFETSVLNCYAEPHRYYHTMQHIIEVLMSLRMEAFLDYLDDDTEDDKLLEESDMIVPDDLFLAAIFHDAVYDPQASDNEEKSASFFEKEAAKAKLAPQSRELIQQMILDTKHHIATTKPSEKLIKADLGILNESFGRMSEYELQIFKEYQYVDYKTYLPKRIEFLKKSEFFNEDKKEAYIDYVERRKPFIGVFAGSFNPFHKGHYNVLLKAEKIFDKVIVAFGKNTDKEARTWPIPKTIKNRQVEEYNGLLTDFVQSLSYDVVVIRGLRNSTDFQYEQNQYRYIQELMPGIKIINIFCDKEFEHISSSGIRTLEKFDKHYNYLLE